MNKKIIFERFSVLRPVVEDCELETTQEQESLFKALVKCLVRKQVLNSVAVVLPQRDSALNYLLTILPKLEREDLDLLKNSPDEFGRKFIFSPTQNLSLYSALEELGFQEDFKGIPITVIFEMYRDKTGYSPYEKPYGKDLKEFLAEIECL